MENNEIIVISLCLIWVIILPYVLKDKIFQFITLMILPFVYCYLLYSTILDGRTFSAMSIALFTLLAGGIIFKAIKFYKMYLTN
jgi:hypothetical protein